MTRHPGEPLDDHPVRRPPIERVAVIPSLDEGAEQVADDRPAQRQRGIVPRCALAVPGIHRSLLRVPEVLRIVAALVRQVDAADERYIPLRVTPMPYDD